MFAAISGALASGFMHTLPVIAGIVDRDLILLLFALYGLSAIAETFNVLFMTMKYLGGAYLNYLGYKLLRAKTEDISTELQVESSLFCL